ncbi:MAG: hypothetical protein PHO34_00035 [Candidatus Omnitrophica bacterium]|nr:hypothetical protein [Candidatus Omnitrophota bacterium]MDD5042329.1 hypothetical protein [Candidatus Omnitrophota bacterium]MDD5500446.1 hypothetical protein [Candidatus Omnitrophota bacterium]
MDKAKKIFTWLGIVLILITGLVHLIDAPDSFSDAPYKGWLFYVNFAGALLAALGIFFDKLDWGWNLGFLIAAGSILAYIASRTVGLPFIPPEPDEWLEPLGVASLIAEGLFIAVFAARGLAAKKA